MKKVLVALCVALLVGGSGLWFSAGRSDRIRQRHDRLLRHATHCLDQGNLREASVCLRQVLEAAPRDISALKMTAQLAERCGSPEAIDGWRKVLDLEPSIGNRLSYAAACLRFEGAPYALTAEALDAMGPAAGDLAPYHLLRSEVALRLGNKDDALPHLQSALRVNPSDRATQVRLAALQLQSTNLVEAGRARTILTDLSTDRMVGAAALRCLALAALVDDDLDQAEELSARLVFQNSGNQEDALVHLAILSVRQKPILPEPLTTLQRNCGTDPLAVFALATWMVRQGLVDEATSWVKGLDEETRWREPIPLVFVEACVKREDWTGLEEFLRSRAWVGLEFLRLAYLSLALEKQGHGAAAEAQWRLAVRAAGDRLGVMVGLLKLARDWGWEQAYEELLWRIAQRFPSERWSFGELDRYYTQRGDSRALFRLYGMMLRTQPDNLLVQNNFSTLALLLGKDLSRAHELAERAYAARPQDAAMAATYAYSLHLRGRRPEGLRALEILEPTQLEDGPGTLYYAVLLQAAGHSDRAAPFFQAARRRPLLPEERALLPAAPSL